MTVLPEQPADTQRYEDPFHLSEVVLLGLSLGPFFEYEPEKFGPDIAAALDVLPRQLTLSATKAIYSQVKEYVDESPPRRLRPGQGNAHARAALTILYTEAALLDDNVTAANVCETLQAVRNRRAVRLGLQLKQELFGESPKQIPPTTLQTA